MYYEDDNDDIVEDWSSVNLDIYEERAEDVLAAAMNIESANENLGREIDAMKRLVDNLRHYRIKFEELDKIKKEAKSLL